MFGGPGDGFGDPGGGFLSSSKSSGKATTETTKNGRDRPEHFVLSF